MDPIRVGVVGVGHLGQHHARHLSELPDCTLVGVVDIDKRRAAQIAGRLDTEPFTDYRQLVGRVDAVSVVVPTVAHYDVSKAFLDSGAHVLVEKPITNTLEEARELINLARERDLILQVGHIERFNSAILRLQELLTHPGFIESHRLGPYNPRIKDVGVVLDLMIHDIDIILQIVRSQILSIDAVGVPILSDREDIANARIKFKNGCTANLTVSRVTPNQMRKIRIFQPNMYVSVDYMKPGIEVYTKEEIADAEEGEPTEQIRRRRLRIRKEDQLRAELSHFLECIREGSTPAVTGEHAQDALEVAIQIVEQIQARRGDLDGLMNHDF